MRTNSIIDAAMAELVASIPAGWRLNFLSEADGVWQVVVRREADGQAQEGRGAAVSEALAEMNGRIEAGAPTTDAEAINRHRTVDVHVGGRRADIDEGIARLIEALWESGIETQSSCEGGPSAPGHITFPDPEYAAAFLDIMGAAFDPSVESLWNRAAREDEPEDWAAHRATQMWSYSADAQDYSVRESDGELRREGEGPDFGFTLTVRFPHGDIPRMIEAVELRR